MSDTTSPLEEKAAALCLVILWKIYAHMPVLQDKVSFDL